MRFLKLKLVLILKLRIEAKRKNLYKKANDLGFTHPEVVNCSQKLDELLNKYSDCA
ncbi:MAG: aspartyl-phosphate phosphatase Spo0E family protein [Solibacillus sp.]|uniref:aspartyl-phosphate phosphatase Spo0E family protein n=1 Tax=Solibacillus sp. TaxID=1909654 RepID=UPI003314FE64